MTRLQIHVSEDRAVLFWSVDGSIVKRWGSDDEDLPVGIETVMADVRLVFDAVERSASEIRLPEGDGAGRLYER